MCKCPEAFVFTIMLETRPGARSSRLPHTGWVEEPLKEHSLSVRVPG